MWRNRDGITLVEVLVTVALVALLSTTASIAVPPMLDSYRVSKEITLLTGALREAQLRAVGEGRLWRVYLHADGLGYSLESQAQPSATQDCNSVGWAVSKEYRLDRPIRISMQSRACATFDATGRGLWPNPVIVMSQYQESPKWGGQEALIRLTDGGQPDFTDFNFQPWDTRVAFWERTGASPPPVRVHLDATESRYFDRICFEVYSAKRFKGFGYPPTIRADVAPDGPFPTTAAGWTKVYEGSGPTDPATGRMEHRCQSVPIGATARYIRLTLTPNGNAVVLSETAAADLVMTLTGQRSSKTLTVNPITGRAKAR